jgi:hypothetical protein
LHFFTPMVSLKSVYTVFFQACCKGDGGRKVLEISRGHSVCEKLNNLGRKWVSKRITLKGQCHEIFRFWYPIRTVSNFFTNFRRPGGRCTLSCEYLREFSKTFGTALMVYSGAWGKLIHEKHQKSKIS